MTTQEQVIHYNKIIASFMGAEFRYFTLDEKDTSKTFLHHSERKHFPENELWRCSFTPKDPFSWYFPDTLEYHTDWNWLMEVVEKLGHRLQNPKNSNYWDDVKQFLVEGDILQVWRMVAAGICSLDEATKDSVNIVSDNTSISTW